MKYRTQTPYANERRLLYASLSFLFVVMSLYMYFLSASIVHVVVRKEVDQKISSARSEIGMLETRYIDAKDAITPESVEKYGFRTADSKIYITRAPSDLVLRE